CAYWTDRTAIAPYLKKGTQVYVEGQPDVRTYTTKDGTNGATLSLRVVSVQLLGSRSNDQSANNSTNSYQPAPPMVNSASTPSASDITEP
ncbi:single-stranded DNA-binding protein, partial [Acinetobacter baumannii]